MTTCEDLAANWMFAGIDFHLRAAICEGGEVISANSGDLLIEEGRTNTHLYLVVNGEVEVCLPKTRERYSATRLRTLGAGSSFGEYAFIDTKPASASVIAKKPTLLFRISYEKLKLLMGTNPTLGHTIYRNLLVDLIDRLRASNAELDVLQTL